MPIDAEYEPGAWDFAADHVRRYEASGGSGDDYLLMGKPCIILHTLGNKTGKLRKSPLMRVTDGKRYAVVASMGGAPKHPVWYHNLTANPRCALQDKDVLRDYVAREVTGDEKAEWWGRATEVWPSYDEYQAKTDREIPVFVLDPVT
jgi:deazaflavin-dependent oxidoreductase (nitroreductase family)